MKLSCMRSGIVYKRTMEAPAKKRNDIYRCELMMPLKDKWDCYQIPMRTATPNDYDIIMASGMLGFISPIKIDQSQKASIENLSSDRPWVSCEQSIQRSPECFLDNGVELPVNEHLFTTLLANTESPYIPLNEGYCGDGGVPEYIMAWLIPNEFTLARLPVALTCEVDHSVHLQFIKRRNSIILGEMMVSEDLAENFATHLYDEDKVGSWVIKTDMQILNEYIKPIIHDGLNVQGLENLNTYLYGDEMVAIQNFPCVGLPYCASYTCGYHLVEHYLQKTGKDITEATMSLANEILETVEDFWDE